MLYKLSFNQKIAFSAVLAAICIAIKSISINIPPLKISFSYIPNFLAGIYLGPLYGLAVGLVGDVLGTLIQGGTPIILFAIANSLIGFCMGMVFHYSYVKNLYFKIIAGAFTVLVIVTYGVNTLAFTLPAPLGWPLYATYTIALTSRMLQGVVLAVNTAIVLALYPVLDKAYFNKYKLKSQKT
ncbi:MAG: folate family ECF transporter S component [Clostridia bacterium]|nr:folate family ECF transporter S component [Clostridia bacterium]